MRILHYGGNAYDAALSASAVLSVVQPDMCGLGGDGFILAYDSKDDKIKALNSGGRAPGSSSIDTFSEKGFRVIPQTGILSVSVPGLVRAWEWLFDNHCTLPLKDLLHDAIFYAKNGFPLYPLLLDRIVSSRSNLEKFPASAEIFLGDANSLIVGNSFVQADLARTLSTLVYHGLDSFYSGRLGQLIVESSLKNGGLLSKDDLLSNGGLLSKDDLLSYRAEEKEPISVSYKGYRIYEQPPMSQGYMLLQMLKMIEPIDISELPEHEIIHLLVEAKKQAFEERIEKFGDPEFTKLDIERLISEENADQLRKQIDRDRARRSPPGTELGGDTTYFCVVDSNRNMVSFIQSVFQVFGSAFTVEGTGIVLNDRMLSFSLERDHPNAFVPFKKPAHTLNSYIVTKDGRPCIVGGTPGADDQVQVNLQILCKLLDLGFEVQQAIEAPRWSSRPGTLPAEEKNSYTLALEDRFSKDIVDDLVPKGHDIELIDGWSIGATQICRIHEETRSIVSAADPRREGFALGY